jgi:general L-amino acid transport system permease protein
VTPTTPRPGWSLSRPARAWAWQCVAVAAFLALVLWLGHNARVNMTQRNITFGFDFLWHTAGFDIPFHLLSWENTDTYAYALLVCG